MREIVTLSQARPDVQRKFMAGVYSRMTVALLISAGVAWYASNSVQVLRFLFSNGAMPFYALMIAEFALVIMLSAAIRKLSAAAATVFFLLYAVVNGLSLCTIFMIYDITSIYRMFIVSALMFGGMSVYGSVTKTDLTSAGRYLFMALLGLVITGLVNFIFRSAFIDWMTSLLGVGIFIGITAYDTQRLMRIGVYNDGSENFQKMAVIGALELYLDFINIFLKMLALFGKRKR